MPAEREPVPRRFSLDDRGSEIARRCTQSEIQRAGFIKPWNWSRRWSGGGSQGITAPACGDMRM